MALSARGRASPPAERTVFAGGQGGLRFTEEVTAASAALAAVLGEAAGVGPKIFENQRGVGRGEAEESPATTAIWKVLKAGDAATLLQRASLERVAAAFENPLPSNAAAASGPAAV